VGVDKTFRDGWHRVDTSTEIEVKTGTGWKISIIRVRTTAYDLDASLDRAGQFWGVPLDRISPWLTADGKNPENTDTGDHSLVTCDVKAQE
jgi:hypothetical protein